MTANRVKRWHFSFPSRDCCCYFQSADKGFESLLDHNAEQNIIINAVFKNVSYCQWCDFILHSIPGYNLVDTFGNTIADKVILRFAL